MFHVNKDTKIDKTMNDTGLKMAESYVAFTGH